MNAPITRELTYSQAIQEALAQAMDADPRVFLMGEDIGVYGGAFQVTGDLVHRYGEDRVMDTPIAELGAAGGGVGGMPSGLRVSVLGFLGARSGADRQSGGEDPLHAGRQDLGAAGDAVSRG